MGFAVSNRSSSILHLKNGTEAASLAFFSTSLALFSSNLAFRSASLAVYSSSLSVFRCNFPFFSSSLAFFSSNLAFPHTFPRKFSYYKSYSFLFLRFSCFSHPCFQGFLHFWNIIFHHLFHHFFHHFGHDID